MAQENIKKMLQDRYNSMAFTDQYIMGYRFADMVYMTVCNAHIVDMVTCLDKASRGAEYALRFKPNKAQKAILMTENMTPLCSVRFFDDMVKESKYNKGEIFEKLVTEYYGQEWVKDSIPFTEAGDIEVDGIAFQIKYEFATFTNEKTLARLSK